MEKIKVLHMPADIHPITGTSGYSGKCIAKRLPRIGKPVITSTHSPHRENPFGMQINAYPFTFSEPEKLRYSLKGVKVLYKTYWIQFNDKKFGHTPGPEIFAYRDLAQKNGSIICKKRPIIPLPARLEFIVGKIMGMLKRDVMIACPKLLGLLAVWKD